MTGSPEVDPDTAGGRPRGRRTDIDPVSVILVDDHEIWRGGVRSMLEETEFTVVGEAASRDEALALALRTRPRIVLLDIRMAGGDGLETLHDLKQAHPQLAVVMLTTYDNPTFMARAVAGGAAGYLLKGVTREELLEALRKVAHGELLLAPQDLIRSLRPLGEQAATEVDLVEPLTQREEEVLRLLATGLSNRDIAAILYIAESTVKTHVENIIGKLGVSDRVQAAVWAVRVGVAPRPE